MHSPKIPTKGQILNPRESRQAGRQEECNRKTSKRFPGRVQASEEIIQH